jgi:hypothetical protein
VYIRLVVEKWDYDDVIDTVMGFYVDRASTACGKMLLRVLDAVPDEEAFYERVALRSAQRYAQMVADPNRAVLIMAKKCAKMMMEYETWRRRLEEAVRGLTESYYARRLVEGRYREFLQYFLPWVGHKYFLWGAGTIVSLFLTGDYRAESDLAIWEEVYGGSHEGEPVVVCSIEYLPAVRKCLIDVFSAFGWLLLYAAERGFDISQIAGWIRRAVDDIMSLYGCEGCYLNIDFSGGYPVTMEVRARGILP